MINLYLIHTCNCNLGILSISNQQSRTQRLFIYCQNRQRKAADPSKLLVPSWNQQMFDIFIFKILFLKIIFFFIISRQNEIIERMDDTCTAYLHLPFMFDFNVLCNISTKGSKTVGRAEHQPI